MAIRPTPEDFGRAVAYFGVLTEMRDEVWFCVLGNPSTQEIFSGPDEFVWVQTPVGLLIDTHWRNLDWID